MDPISTLATQNALKQRLAAMVQELDAVTGTEPSRYVGTLHKFRDIFRGDAQDALDNNTYARFLRESGIQRPLLDLLTSRSNANIQASDLLVVFGYFLPTILGGTEKPEDVERVARKAPILFRRVFAALEEEKQAQGITSTYTLLYSRTFTLAAVLIENHPNPTSLTSTLDGSHLIRSALVMEFNPHLLTDLVARLGPNRADTLFNDIMTLIEQFHIQDPKLLPEALINLCGIPNVTKQLLRRIGQLRKWGPTGYTTILQIIHALQSKEDFLVAFVDSGVYNRIIAGYWKLERLSGAEHRMTSRQLALLLSHAVATIGEEILLLKRNPATFRRLVVDLVRNQDLVLAYGKTLKHFCKNSTIPDPQSLFDFVVAKAEVFGDILAEGLRDDPGVMQTSVHPAWLKILDDGRAMWKANPSKTLQLSLDMWLKIGKMIGADEDKLRQEQALGDASPHCAWYRCPLFASPAPCGSMMRCSGCKSVFYCSLHCQTRDWKEGDHKVQCRAATEPRLF